MLMYRKKLTLRGRTRVEIVPFLSVVYRAPTHAVAFFDFVVVLQNYE